MKGSLNGGSPTFDKFRKRPAKHDRISGFRTMARKSTPGPGELRPACLASATTDRILPNGTITAIINAAIVKPKSLNKEVVAPIPMNELNLRDPWKTDVKEGPSADILQPTITTIRLIISMLLTIAAVSVVTWRFEISAVAKFPNNNAGKST